MADKNTFARERHHEDRYLQIEKARKEEEDEAGRDHERNAISRSHYFLHVMFWRWNTYNFTEKYGHFEVSTGNRHR